MLCPWQIPQISDYIRCKIDEAVLCRFIPRHPLIPMGYKGSIHATDIKHVPNNYDPDKIMSAGIAIDFRYAHLLSKTVNVNLTQKLIIYIFLSYFKFNLI